MKRATFSTILCLVASIAFAQTINVNLSEKPVTNGFADLGKLSYGKKVVTIDDSTYPNPIEKRKAFTKAISARASTTIILSGDIDLSDGAITDDDHSYFDKFEENTGKRQHEDFMYKIESNKTILGKENARIKFGGLDFSTGKNLIIRNVTFWDAHGSTEYSTAVKSESKASADALVIWDKKSAIPSDIWIDHCTFTDGKCEDLQRNFNHDGSIDICGAKNMTISFCEFTNHDKVMLVGSGEKFSEQKERQVTLHHNYFHHVTQRLPRSRGTQMHIYNNVYDDIGVENNGGYMFGPGTGSQYIVENNYLGTHLEAIVSYFDKTSGNGSTFSHFFQSGNSQEITEKDVKWDKTENAIKFSQHFVSSKDDMPWKIGYKYEMTSYNEAYEKVMNEGVGANANLNIEK